MKKSELRQIIREQIKQLTESTHEYGFDLTDIPARRWKELLKQFNIPEKPKLVKRTGGYSQWEWHAKDGSVTIITANDPITGERAGGGRKPEKNYASYIGITGDADAVQEIADFIKQHGSYKGHQPGRRDYI